MRDPCPWQRPLPGERRRHDKFKGPVERDLRSTSHQQVCALPRPLTRQERVFLGHPTPMVPDRPRPARLPDARQAPPLGFVLAGLHPHHGADQLRDLRPPGPHALDNQNRAPGRNLDGPLAAVPGPARRTKAYSFTAGETAPGPPQ